MLSITPCITIRASWLGPGRGALHPGLAESRPRGSGPWRPEPWAPGQAVSWRIASVDMYISIYICIGMHMHIYTNISIYDRWGGNDRPLPSPN